MLWSHAMSKCHVHLPCLRTSPQPLTPHLPWGWRVFDGGLWIARVLGTWSGGLWVHVSGRCLGREPHASIDLLNSSTWLKLTQLKLEWLDLLDFLKEVCFDVLMFWKRIATIIQGSTLRFEISEFHWSIDRKACDDHITHRICGILGKGASSGCWSCIVVCADKVTWRDTGLLDDTLTWKFLASTRLKTSAQPLNLLPKA